LNLPFNACDPRSSTTKNPENSRSYPQFPVVATENLIWGDVRVDVW
jgi:hypothetical protein